MRAVYVTASLCLAAGLAGLAAGRAVTARVGAAASSDCAGQANCGNCVAVDDCQWCPLTGACMSTSQVCVADEKQGGPVTSSSSCSGADPYEHLTNCSACTSSDTDTGVNGWCPGEGRCYFGTDDAPLNHTCVTTGANGTWTTDNEYCAAVNPTALLRNCSACTNAEAQHGYPGWCPVLGKCILGTEDAPFNETCVTTGANGTWTTDNEYCAAVNPTALLRNCSACTNAEAQHGYPGWCPVLGKCILGSEDAPYNVTCSTTGANGTWTTDNEYCSGTNPTTLLRNCSACINAEAQHGYPGWCPVLGKCILGSEDAPFNETCPTTGANGTWSTSSCSAVNPLERLRNCSACLDASPDHNEIGWCPSTNQCYLGNDTAPFNATCPYHVNLGVYTHDCDCTVPAAIISESTCRDCDFTYCPYTMTCRAPPPSGLSAAALADWNPCPERSCPLNCLCNASTSVCAQCTAGFWGIATGCVQRCRSNCHDCRDADPTQCRTQCAAGYTNFPACDQPCDPKCLACGGGYNGSKAGPDQCLLCADVAAVPPACTTCMPGVCKGPHNTCHVPCDSRARNASGFAVALPPGLAPLADYDKCDDCQRMVEALQKIRDFLHTLWEFRNEAKEMAEVLQAFEEECAALTWWCPECEITCAIVFELPSLADMGAWVATWVLEHAFDELTNWLQREAICYGLQQ